MKRNHWGFLVLANLLTGHVSPQTAPRITCLCPPAPSWDFECESLKCPGSNIRKNPSLDAEASVSRSPCFSLQSMNHNRPKYFGSRTVEANIANWISVYYCPGKTEQEGSLFAWVLFTFFLFRPHSFQTTASLYSLLTLPSDLSETERKQRSSTAHSVAAV